MATTFLTNEDGLGPLDAGYAEWLDRNDPLRDMHKDFWIPQKSTVKTSVKSKSPATR
jgi:hypothetical protein